MNVYVAPADQGGCGNYRMIWPAEVLRGRGYAVTLESDNPEGILGVYVEENGREKVLDLVPGAWSFADVVVLQRPLRWEIAEIIPLLQQRGIAVVVDLDDDFGCIHPMNVAYRGTHPDHSPQRNYRHLARAAMRADWVTVSTPALLRYGTEGRKTVLPNCVPERYLDVSPWPRKDDRLIVGWSGSIDTHPEDLEQTRGGVGAAAKDHHARVCVVGTGRGVREALECGKVDASGWLPIEDYPAALASFDVGVVPLKPSPFNTAKSWLKGLEMAAVGVPFVASPLPEYERLAELGAGRLAVRRRGWQTEVSRLLRYEKVRKELAAKGRDVAALWTFERRAARWWDVWTRAYEYRAAKKAAA